MTFWITAKMKPIIRKPPAGRIIMTMGLVFRKGTAKPSAGITPARNGSRVDRPDRMVPAPSS